MRAKEDTNEELVFKCFCGQIIKFKTAEALTRHTDGCSKYSEESPIAELYNKIPLSSIDMPHLIAIRGEFLKYYNQLTQEISKRGYNLHQNKGAEGSNWKTSRTVEFGENIEEELPMMTLNKGLSLSKKKSSRCEDNVYDLGYLAKNIIKCPGCHKEYYDFDTDKIWYISGCCHFYCRACLVKTIFAKFLKNKGQVRCLSFSCPTDLQEFDYLALIGSERYSKLSEELVEQQYNIVTCSKCREKYEFLPGKADGTVKDNTGRPLDPQSALHYSQNRFVCQNAKCKTDQCRSCKMFPYHLGMTCEEHSRLKWAKKCRYCEQVITAADLSRPPAFRDICNEEECLAKMGNACDKTLACGHNCSGFHNETECLPCLEENCAELKKEELLEQRGTDYCNICFIEGLSNAPSLQLDCGHIFHYHCLEKRLKMRWHRPRITFNFCLCPLCKVWITLPPSCPLNLLVKENLEKFEAIKEKSMMRLKHEGRDKDERLNTVGDPYYNKPIEYAIAIFSYYECFKCKKSYFGGLKRCEDMMDDDKKSNVFKPEELVCAGCCDVGLIENCDKHGTEYIEYKCKFCCAVAQWFCWGTTHFCEPCHARVCNGDDVSQYSKDRLPKCQGPGKCPLGGTHAETGVECALGCSLCRNLKENFKEF